MDVDRKVAEHCRDIGSCCTGRDSIADLLTIAAVLIEAERFCGGEGPRPYPVISLPEPVRQDRYNRLIGLDEVKQRLRKEASILADPTVLTRWATRGCPGLRGI